MPLLKETGTFEAAVKAHEFSESKNGTPFLYITFETPSGTIGSWSYLSEKAFPHTVKALREAFDFNGDFDSLSSTLNGKKCSIVVDEELDDRNQVKLRVKWINKLGARVAPIANKESFLAGLSKRAKMIPKDAPKVGAPKAGASKPAPTPPVDDSDVPF